MAVSQTGVKFSPTEMLSPRRTGFSLEYRIQEAYICQTKIGRHGDQ